MNYTIRKALLNDVDKITELEKICFPKEEAATRDSFIERLNVYANHFIVVESEDDIICVVNGLVTNHEDLLDEMYADANYHNEDGKWQMIFGVETHPDYQGRGIASMALQRLIVGLLHDIDFELYPAEHCLKAPELLKAAGVSDDIIHAVCSHGYGITVECGVTIDVEPIHEMEKVLFAADELTGLIWAAALMRPSKSTKDMELKSLKKKYKSKGFAAGCSREVIERGADQLGWELDKLLTMTLQAMADSEDEINLKMEDV